MLLLAISLICLAMLLGAGLTVWHLRAGEWLGRRIPPWSLGLLHGGLGFAGLAVLVTALTGSSVAGSGAPTVGYMAAGILTIALLIGMVPLTARLLHRPMPLPIVVFAIHGTIAVYGTVLLIAFLSLLN